MGAVALVPPLVWLIGLAIVLRKSAPTDRPDILRAYAALRLPTAKVGGSTAMEARQIADAEKADRPDR